MKLETGSSIPGGLLLTEQLSTVGWYISTWRARGPCDQEVVVKFHYTVVSDDYPNIIDLRDEINPLCPRLDRLVAAPATPGLAPWLRYSYAPDSAYLFLVRPYYATRLNERFAPGTEIERDGTPKRELVVAFQQLAEGVDGLCRLPDEDPAPAVHADNLFVEGSQAVLADYGCWDLQQTVENGYVGPRPVNYCQLKRAAISVFLQRTGGDIQEKAQSALAAAYFRVRTGRSVFGDCCKEGKTNTVETLAEAYKQVGAYLSSQVLDLGILPHAGERAALARALAINPRERFRSCVEFVQCLPS
jgi:hypothetical protein